MEFPENIDSKFRFVLVAANRAEQLMRGAPAKVQPIHGKATTLALRELKQDLVPWARGEAPEATSGAAPTESEASEDLN